MNDKNCFFIFVMCVLHSVKSWSDKLGFELWHLGNFITRRKEVQEVSIDVFDKFHFNATIGKINWKKKIFFAFVLNA